MSGCVLDDALHAVTRVARRQHSSLDILRHMQELESFESPFNEG